MCKGDLNDAGLYQNLKHHLHRRRTRPRHRRQLPVLPGRGRPLLRPGRRAARPSRAVAKPEETACPAGTLAPRGDRKAVRPRRRLRPRTERRDPARAAEEDQIYPDRSFPRQGDGAEHHGVPLRQRTVRADLEPRPHRPRADHGGGNRRRGTPRPVLRDRPARLRDMVPNHVFQLLAMVAMEPPGGFDARAVRSRKADVFAAMRTRRAGGCGARPVRSRPDRRPRVPGYRAGAGRRAGLGHRNLRRAAAGDRQLALGRRAVLPAHRQAHVARASPRSPSASSPRRTRRSRTPTSPRCRPTGWCCTSSRMRASRCSSR